MKKFFEAGGRYDILPVLIQIYFFHNMDIYSKEYLDEKMLTVSYNIAIFYHLFVFLCDITALIMATMFYTSYMYLSLFVIITTCLNLAYYQTEGGLAVYEKKKLPDFFSLIFYLIQTGLNSYVVAATIMYGFRESLEWFLIIYFGLKLVSHFVIFIIRGVEILQTNGDFCF